MTAEQGREYVVALILKGFRERSPELTEGMSDDALWAQMKEMPFTIDMVATQMGGILAGIDMLETQVADIHQRLTAAEL